VAKDETSRGAELLALGWSAEEVRKYEELWEYRQRWGAINLEPEDRQVLRKAESLLPKRIAGGKGAAKKAIQDKAYYQWLSFYREAMLGAAGELGLAAGEEAAWPIVIEEEQRALDYYQPVLGLPDTLKAKLLIPLREQWTTEAAAAGRTLEFDFIAPLETLKATQTTNWKPLRAEDASNPKAYPVLEAGAAAVFRAKVRQEIVNVIRTTFPSLKDSDKPEPAADWSKGA
jgi:hypothetical protein